MSDHISGPRALDEPIADITDFYAFSTPGRPGWLTLVMNTLPFAQPDDGFSEGLLYRLRLRPIAPDGVRWPAFVPGGRELTLDVTFDEPGDEQRGGCRLPSGDVVSFRVGDEGGGEAAGARAFAGLRWDPFFMDAPSALRTIATQELCFSEQAEIYLDGKAVLGLVLELDCSDLLGEVGPLAVVAETLTRGRHNVRIERTGRPEVKNLMLAPKQFDQVNRDLEIRDLYNMEDAFHLGESYPGAYRARLDANLAFWDGLDGKVDWPLGDEGMHPLRELVLADFLVVDPSRPFTPSGSFLEPELAARDGRPHETCGGRALNDDVMDTIFTLLVTGGNGAPITDGIDGASRPASDEFPYLAEPLPDPPKQPEHHH
jgi:hypothetical protein